MNKQESENVTDRELFSELFETSINPLLIHMVPPFIDENLPDVSPANKWRSSV